MSLAFVHSLLNMLSKKASYSANNSKIPRKLPLCVEPTKSLLPRKASPLDDRNFITLKARALHQYFLPDSFCSSKSLQMLTFLLFERYMLKDNLSVCWKIRAWPGRVVHASSRHNQLMPA